MAEGTKKDNLLPSMLSNNYYKLFTHYSTSYYLSVITIKLSIKAKKMEKMPDIWGSIHKS